ncbi:SGNH/GDSL hydrolase family protein [Acinetobacter baumannii]|nr:SGNH/GDSL hydrolase family protein [Acinetobacter baumannii]
MAQLAPMMQLRARFEDKCGHPLAGGSVFAFEVGTSTPKDTYADANGTIQNTHPIKLDYRGEADIFLLSGRYRFVVYSCTGVEIYDVDNVGEWLGQVSAENVIDGDKSQHEINEEQASKNVQLTELIASSVEVEKQRALLAESTLQTNINTENTRATGAESTLNTKIDNETSRALGVEQSLQLQISTSNAGIKYFQTEAALLATTPGTTDPKQAYAFDTKKNYLWNGSAWVGEGKSQYDLAVDFVNANPNFKFQTIATGIDFDTYKTPGQFAISTTNFQASTNKPNTTVGGVLIVYGSGAGYLTAQEYRSYNNEVFFRFFTNVWSAWSTLAKLSDFNAKSIASAADFNTYKSIGQYTITGTILTASTYTPPVTVGGVLSVDGSGADYLTSQRFTTWTNEVYTRALTNVWSPWKKLAFNSDFDVVAITAGIDFDTYKTQKTYSVTNIAIQASTHAPASTFGGILRVIGTGANYLTQQIYIDYKGVYFYRALEVNWTPWFKLVTSEVTDNLAAQIAAIQTPSTGLTGKKWLAVGDSITVGLNATKSYADVLAERYSATLTKHATSGAWISAGTGTIAIPNILSQTYTSLPDSANFDFITIAAGTNDRINGTDGNLGVFDDRTTATFYGALHTLIAGLKTKYPNARMLFMSQTPRSGLRTNPTTPTDLDKKFKAITEVCDYYAVPVFAGHKCFDFHPDDNATFKSTYMPDGLHPSDAGHIWYANRLEQAILSNAK